MINDAQEVHLWRCACPASPDAICEFLHILSADELERAESYSREEDGRRFITSRGMLRHILSGHVGMAPEELKFRLGIFGKPRLDRYAGCTVPFNLSRAGDRMLIAVLPGGIGEVGVDLVEIRPNHGVNITCRELLAAHFPQFAKAEYSERECERVFARLWSQSEAILKARGTGLSAPSLPVSDCVPSGPLNVWRDLSDGLELGRIVCELAPIEGFAASLVIPGPLRAPFVMEGRIRIFDGNFERPLKNNAATLQEVRAAAL